MALSRIFPLAHEKITIPHTFAVGGTIALPSGDTDLIPAMFVPIPAGRTAKLVGVRHRMNAGTTVTYKVQKNDADVTGFTGLTAETTAETVDPADVSLAANDKLAIVITAVSGTCKNLSVTLFIEYGVA